jgi:hypothetical protein
MKFTMYRAHLQFAAALGAPEVSLRPKEAAMLDRASAIPSRVLDGQINSGEPRSTGGEPGVLAPLLFPVA